MGPAVRPATGSDLDALVALRIENGRVHVALDPTVYRVPDDEHVRRYFAGWLADPPADAAVLVAEVDGVVVGLAEVSIDGPVPDHQVLQPIQTGRLHLVVAPPSRGNGVGHALEQAARQWAVDHGIRRLVAGIQADNETGLAFYGRQGYRDNAMVRFTDL
jgi:GNAT superfamily N-acetyltransferase